MLTEDEAELALRAVSAQISRIAILISSGEEEYKTWEPFYALYRKLTDVLRREK